MDSTYPPAPPSSRRMPATEATFFDDLFVDLEVRIEWLGQVLDSVPDRESSALARLQEYTKALGELRKTLEKLHTHAHDRALAPLFALDGPLAGYLSRLYAWCEEISNDFERLAVGLRRKEAVWSVFSAKMVSGSFSHFDEIAAAVRKDIARMRAGMPPTDAERAFDAHLEEVLWATEWLHMSLARAPGG
jgi:hypothetical protein